ncbi:MAG: nitrous oxide reductase accessory protein NosL [bacterium]
MMDRRRFLKAALVAGTGVVTAPTIWALATHSEDETGPPMIAYGRDRCDACGMIIGDPRFAAAARQGSDVHRFDDIGCLIRHSRNALAGGQARGFVHDVESELWIPAPGAWYVRLRAIRTPMNYGIAAFTDADGARRAYPGSEAMTFDAALAALVEKRS